jgi:hypothetical protein
MGGLKFLAVCDDSSAQVIPGLGIMISVCKYLIRFFTVSE